MEFKFHDHVFPSLRKFYGIVRNAMIELGHVESSFDSADIHFYNHTCLDNLGDRPTPALFIKPTAPTAKHFVIDNLGYANSSRLAFEEPIEYEYMYSHLNPKKNMDWSKIESLIENKTNKWDDSILLKWRLAKNIPKDHILIIGQIPEDEVTNGFGFKGHFDRLRMIVDKLQHENIVVKLHPSFKPRGKTKDIIDSWIQNDIDVRDGFNSIHDFLPYARVAIIDNSTSGIECLMHEVPIISYGWPEYHWVTEKLQSLTQLKGLVNDISWHRSEAARNFIYWYVHDYLCHDHESTKRRLDGIFDC